MERDGCNVYGENNKSSRKNIPHFKAQSNRRGGRGAKVAFNAMIDDDTGEAETCSC